MMSIILRQSIKGASRARVPLWKRPLSTLDGNPHIYVFPDERRSGQSILTLLSSSPPNADLAIGTTTQVPPSTESFVENRKFLSILQAVLKDHAHNDPGVKSQAQAFVSNAGATLGSGGAFFAQGKANRPGYGGGGGTGGDGAGGASGQGGAGGGGRGGWIHVSDERNPPDFGRIAIPEDIFGSLEVDSEGNFVDGHGRYQDSGTYRIVTREGILGISPFLREKLIERLKTQGQASN